MWSLFCKILRWDTRQIKYIIGGACIVPLVIGLNSVLILKLFSMGAYAMDVLVVNEIIATYLIGGLMLALLLNLLLQIGHKPSLWRQTGISLSRIVVARYMGLFAILIVASSLAILSVSMVDMVCLADYSEARFLFDTSSLLYSMVGRSVLSWLFPLAIGFFGCILLSGIYFFLSMMGLFENRLAGFFVALVASMVLIFLNVAAYNGFSYVLNAKLFSASDSILPVNTCCYLLYGYWFPNARFCLYSLNIFDGFVVLYELIFILFCVNIHHLCEKLAHA